MKKESKFLDIFYKEKKFNKKYIIIITSFVILLIVSFIFQGRKTGAQIAYFYPDTCLGGWKNSTLATGKPDITSKNGVLYNEENSATIFNTISQIFCSGFKGEIPHDTEYKKVTLHFSWMLEGDAIDTLPVEIPSEDVDLNMPESNSETSVDESNIQLENIIETPADSVENTDSSISDIDHTSDSDQSSGQTSTEVNVEAEPAPEENGTQEPISFLSNFLYTPLYAQETNQSETSSDTSSQEIVSEDVLEGQEPSEVLSEPEAPVEVQDVDVIPESTEEIQETEQDQKNDEKVEEVESEILNKIFEVKYTLDGTNWDSLGYVSEIHNDVSFELPVDKVTSVTDLDKMQIALHSISTLDTTPTIYLDSMWIQVDYETKIIPIENSKNFFDLIRETFLNNTDVVINTEVGVVNEEVDPNVVTQNMLQIFAQSVTELKAISDQFVIVKVQIQEGIYELWLFDMISNDVRKIATQEFSVGTYPIGIKNSNIFWLNQDNTILYVYDLRDLTIKSTELGAFKNSAENKYKVPVMFNDWQVTIGSDQFYFTSDETGEVLSDGFSDVNESFIKKYNIDKFLSAEQLSQLGVFIESTQQN